MPPVGTTASAVLVDFAGCGRRRSSTALLTKRSCIGLDGFSSAIGTDACRACGSTSATASVVTRLVSRNSAARQFVQIFPRRHAQRQRQQIAGAAHVEGVFGKPADVALDDHQILRGVARGLGVVGAIAHPDLMHADMRRLRHVARLARQQQEHAHRLAIGFRHRRWRDRRARSACTTLMPTVVSSAEAAEASAERDGIVDRAAAGIQHDGRAAELASARELVELPRAVRGDDADGADPAPAIGLAGDPAELHRQFAFFEGAAGVRRIAQRRDRAGQCDAKGGGAEERPAAKF